MLELRFKDNPKKAYFHFTIYDNSTIDREWIESKKNEHYAKGDGHVWEREYMARFVRGGKNHVYPMLNEKHFRPYNDVLRQTKRDRHHMQHFCIVDPGTTTVFAGLLAAWDPYNTILYLIDEIYKEGLGQTSVGQVIPEIQQKRMILGSRKKWINVYDEAAAWFYSEVLDQFKNEIWEPTQKSKFKNEEQRSKIKDMLLNYQIIISDRCIKWRYEAYNYILDEHGRLPKKHDHLMDCTNYLVSKINPYRPHIDATDDPGSRRAYALDEDIQRIEGEM